LYALAEDETSGNQVWHLPTATALTGKQLIELAARIFDTQPRYMEVNKLFLNTIGLFNKLIRETAEMYYQYEFDYDFSSAKFEKAFNIFPTSYEKGIEDFSKKLLHREA
jgi:hypothetical protein